VYATSPLRALRKIIQALHSKWLTTWQFLAGGKRKRPLTRRSKIKSLFLYKQSIGIEMGMGRASVTQFIPTAIHRRHAASHPSLH
jgi:hypothetical protein